MLERESYFYDIVFEALRQAPEGKMKSIELISIGQRRLGVSAPTVRNYLNALLCLDGNPIIKIGNMVTLQFMPKERPPRYSYGNNTGVKETLTVPDIRHRESTVTHTPKRNLITNWT